MSVRNEMEYNESWFISRYSEMEGKNQIDRAASYSIVVEFMDYTDVWFSRSVTAPIPVGAI